MPRLTTVIWNVETFGDRWDAARGAAYVPICNFIATMLNEVNADIFIMMELRSGGVPYLPTLQAAIDNLDPNFNWEYDYIPGAVVPGQARPINLAGQLGFVQQAHGEGYAVLWRDNPEFNLLATRVNMSGHPVGGNSHIDLTFNGRTPAPWGVNDLWYHATNFDPANPPAPWGDLDFPVPNPIHEGDTRLTLCRRPCVCVLDLVNRGVNRGDKLLPIVVFHAPNSTRSTRFAVQLDAYSSDLYQVDDTTQGAPTMITVNQAITAGDYNLDHNDLNTNWRVDAYNYITSAYAAGGGGNNGGANLGTTWVTGGGAATRTAVRLADNNGNINTNNPADYRWLAIDNIFFNNLVSVGPGGYHGPVCDLITAVMQNNWMVSSNAKRTIIQSFRQAILTELAANNYQYTNPANGTPSKTRKRQRDGTYIYSGPVVGGLLNYNNYMADLQLGYFRHARRAAQFIFNSISDHLPLVFRFNI